MSRHLGVLSIVVVGGLLWLVMAWRPTTDDHAVAIVPPVPEAPPPSASAPVEPPPSAAPPAPPAAPPSAAVAEPPAEESESEPADPPGMPPEMIKGDQGPVEEIRKLFAAEPRGSNAHELESQLAGFFAETKGTEDLIKSILCRQTLCRIEINWKRERVRPYVEGITKARYVITYPVALSPLTEYDASGTRSVEIFVKRK